MMSPPSDLILRSAARSVETRRRIGGLIRQTPVLPSRIALPGGGSLHYKTENFQTTGSFKFRGACAKLTTLPLDTPLVTASSGNHGIACSEAARKTGHQLTVVLPETVIDKKRETIESYGTKVIIAGADSHLAEVAARELAESQGYTYVSPYNDPVVVGGQGTIALELLEQCADLDTVFVSMGGGGLISGIGAVLKSFAPHVRVVGVSATHTAALAASIRAGQVVETEHLDTLADGVAGGVDEGSVTLPMATEVIDDIVHCDEDQIAEALRALAWTDNMIVEGAAALALAPILTTPDRFAGKNNLAVLCGGNYDRGRIAGILGTG